MEWRWPIGDHRRSLGGGGEVKNWEGGDSNSIKSNKKSLVYDGENCGRRLPPIVHLTITLPDTAQAYIDEQLASGIYTTADELLTSLILQERKRQTKQKLNDMLRKGLNSGTPIEATDEWWEQKRAKLLQQNSVQP